MTIKKAELHVHLEGTITPTLAHKLAKRNKLTVPDGLIDDDGKNYISADFLHFLKAFDTLADLIKAPQDYYDVTFEYLRDCARDDAIYIEMMYSPEHAEKISGIASIEHLHAIQQAIDDAESQFDIIGRIIITAVRHFGEQSAVHVAEQAALETIPAAVGFGLGGDEINYPPKLFTKAYQIAADAGLSCTAHAGEFAPASSVIEAIECLNIKRVGHGVLSINSPEALALLKERNIALEICPSSNIKLGIYPDMAHHPLPKFLELGYQVSLNSDDPPFMYTTLAQEYDRVQRAYQYSDETMTNITRMAIDCAFADEVTKDELRAKI